MNVHFCPGQDNDAARLEIFRGDILIFPATPATISCVTHARTLIEQAFAPHDPREAHKFLTVERCDEILARLKPFYIHHPNTQELLRRVLIESGCDPRQTYQDVPRLRVAYPADFLNREIAYAHHPHRDTWYSAPSSQLNWWMPLYEFTPEQGMAFHPRYWNNAIANDSDKFNYYRWNADSRGNAASHIGTDPRIQPRAQDPIELDPSTCFVVPPGAIIVYSAAQLHSTVPNTTDMARWSIEFRTVAYNDVQARRGAPIDDSRCTGTSLRNFRRTADFAPMPEEIVAMYDSAPMYDPDPEDDRPSAGADVLIYKPREIRPTR